jgi:hypothetical protein
MELAPENLKSERHFRYLLSIIYVTSFLMIFECIWLKSWASSSTTDVTCTLVCSSSAHLTFETLSRIAYGDASSLLYPDLMIEKKL